MISRRLPTLLCFLAWSLTAVAADPFKLTIGPERVILPDGAQPYMFRSAKGTLIVQVPMFGLTPPVLQPDGTSRWIYRDKNGFYTKICTVRSTDDGETWTVWNPPMDPEDGPITEGTMAQLKDGTIMALQWIAHGPTKDGFFIGKVWESRDEWVTLDGPFESKVYLPRGAVAHDDTDLPFPGYNFHRTLLEMPNGDLLATAYGLFKGDDTPSAYVAAMKKTRSILLRSKDRGRNWTLVSTIAVDPSVGEEGFTEPVLLRLSQGKHKGRLIVHMRTGSSKVLKEAKYNAVYQTESDDDGATWTKPHPLDYRGVNPDLIELESGVLVSGFGWRGIKEKRGNYLAFSLDQGATWTQVTQITGDGDYISIREVRPGRLLFVYSTALRETKRYFITCRTIEVEDLRR